MKPVSIKSLGTILAASTVLLMAIAQLSTAKAHPHDALAMCQLPGGKWVSCDDAIHDVLTDEHVAKSTFVRPGNFKAPASPPRRQLKLR